MNKKVISLIAVVGMTIGSFVPNLLGDNDALGLGSIVGGLVGGIVGIWLGIKIAKRF